MRNEILLANENFEIGSAIEIGPNNISAILPVISIDKFSGKISDFNVWNRSLTNEEMKRFVSKCDESLFDPTSQSVTWSNLKFPLNSSSIKIDKVPKESLCGNPVSSKVTKMFPLAVTFTRATEICRQIGGKMLELQNMIEVNRTSERLRNSSVRFLSNTFQGSWQPIIRSKVSTYFMEKFLRSKSRDCLKFGYIFCTYFKPVWLYYMVAVKTFC